MNNFILIIHIILSIFLVLVVLIQPGRGGGFVMGGGGSQTLFGTTGAGNFLTKLTAILAILLVITSIMLTKIQLVDPKSSVFDKPELAGSLQEGVETKVQGAGATNKESEKASAAKEKKEEKQEN